MSFMLVEKVHSWHDFVGWEFTKPCCYYQTTQYLETRKNFNIRFFYPCACVFATKIGLSPTPLEIPIILQKNLLGFYVPLPVDFLMA